jgi:hypothetical protein
MVGIDLDAHGGLGREPVPSRVDRCGVPCFALTTKVSIALVICDLRLMICDSDRRIGNQSHITN